MSIHLLGERKAGSGAMATLELAATSYTLHTLVAARTTRITKIWAFNPAGGANGSLRIGYGDFTQVLPNFALIAGFESIIEEDSIPEYWWTERTAASIISARTVTSTVVLCMIEVEEKGA